ncbi:MAG: recombinase family protein [Eubacteriales bacterium]|nr:recombinase family protein [Eubacteriales bacterium]
MYEDEGKSGFYADRPDFQRMIRDVERKRIRAIVCYKLDRISRKMSDLTNLIDYLNEAVVPECFGNRAVEINADMAESIITIAKNMLNPTAVQT